MAVTAVDAEHPSGQTAGTVSAGPQTGNQLYFVELVYGSRPYRGNLYFKDEYRAAYDWSYGVEFGNTVDYVLAGSEYDAVIEALEVRHDDDPEPEEGDQSVAADELLGWYEGVFYWGTWPLTIIGPEMNWYFGESRYDGGISFTVVDEDKEEHDLAGWQVAVSPLFVGVWATGLPDEGSAGESYFMVDRGWCVQETGGTEALEVTLDIGGSAEYGADKDYRLKLPGGQYVQVNNGQATVTIPQGVIQLRLDVEVVNDSTPEWTEDIIVGIADGQPFRTRAGSERKTVYIMDNDPVDVEILELPEESSGPGDNEVVPGAYVAANDDHDASDYWTDYDETAETPEEQDLVRVTLTTPTDPKPGATVTLRTSVCSSTSEMRFWLSEHKGGESFTERTWDVAREVVPSEVWLEVGDYDGIFDIILAANDAPPPAPSPSDSTDQAKVTPYRNFADLDVQEFGLPVQEPLEEDPGILVMLNADNDSGSRMTDRIPSRRDMDTGKTASENDMTRLILRLPPTFQGDTRRVRLTWTMECSSQIRVWAKKDKSQGVSSGQVWQLGEQPAELWVEGVELGEGWREINVVLELLQDDKQLREDTLCLSVAPILRDLSVKIAQGSTPDLIPGLGWCLYSEAHMQNAKDRGTGLFGTSADLPEMAIGRLRFVQNVSIKNNLPDGKGADFSNNQSADKSFDFTKPNAGKMLLDVNTPPVPPFLTVHEQFQRRGSTRITTAGDAPSLSVQEGAVAPMRMIFERCSRFSGGFRP